MTERTIVRLELPSRRELLESVDQLVGLLAHAAGFQTGAIEDMEIAVHEALINAIVHGNNSDPARRVTVELAFGVDTFGIRIEDEGPGFDPARVPDPLALENLSKSSGRGILMMRRLMDEVTFCAASGGGTRVAMLKRRESRRSAWQLETEGAAAGAAAD